MNLKLILAIALPTYALAVIQVGTLYESGDELDVAQGRFWSKTSSLKYDLSYLMMTGKGQENTCVPEDPDDEGFKSLSSVLSGDYNYVSNLLYIEIPDKDDFDPEE